MAKTTIEVAAVRAYVEAQLLEQQIAWRDYMEGGFDSSAAATAAVIDKLYEFANLFWGAEIPAPGQGYDPPADVWAKHVQETKLAALNEQIAELQRQRQAILDARRP